MTRSQEAPSQGAGDRIERWSARQVDRLKGLRTRAVLRGLLIAQFGLAAALVWTDVTGRNLLGPDLPITSTPTTPFGPGDQTRPHDLTRVPTRPGAGAPRAPMPASGDGLAFATVEIPGAGPALYLRGAILPGDDARFERWLDEMPEPPARVALHSPGGAVTTALAIGRSIRMREIETHVLAEDACISACPFLLAGGVERIVHREAWVGLHQAAFVETATLSARDAVRQLQVLKADVLDYWSEMNIDPAIEVVAMRIPPEQAYFLLPEELTHFRLSTRMVGQ